MPFYQPYVNTVKGYLNFEGRVGRQEYWMAWLVHVLILAVIVIIGFVAPIFLAFAGLYVLVLTPPFLGLGARRLHDVGNSGWWQLLMFTGIGAIAIVVFALQPSDPAENAYGAPPMMSDDMGGDMSM